MLQICEYDTCYTLRVSLLSIRSKWSDVCSECRTRTTCQRHCDYRILLETKSSDWCDPRRSVCVWSDIEQRFREVTKHVQTRQLVVLFKVRSLTPTHQSLQGEEEVRSIQSTGGEIWVGRGHISSSHKHFRRLKRVLLFCSCSPSLLAASAILSQYFTWI